MKQITCAQMGGPATCNFAISGNSPEEWATNGMQHVMEAHPDLREQIKGMSKEETDEWMEDARAKFEAAPEM